MMISKRSIIWTTVIIFAAIASSVADSRAEYYEQSYRNPISGRAGTVHNIIAIQRVENGLIGIVEGRKEYHVKLNLNEKILWRETRGTIGAVLTENRFLALSEASRGWEELSLTLQEAGNPESINPFISDYLVMLVTNRRVVGFDSGRGKWVQQSIPIHDRIVDSHINSYVAAVITSKRIYAWAWGRIDFKAKRLFRNENIQYVDAQPHTVTVGTDRRVLVFKSERGGWRQF